MPVPCDKEDCLARGTPYLQEQSEKGNLLLGHSRLSQFSLDVNAHIILALNFRLLGHRSQKY